MFISKVNIVGLIGRRYSRASSIQFKHGFNKPSIHANDKNNHSLSSTNNEPTFPGICNTYWTSNLNFVGMDSYPTIPVYRLMNTNGIVIDESQMPNLDKVTIIKMYKDMVMLNVMDSILYESQRQGRISFYMTNTGEEGSHVGSAAALTSEDLIYAQYREAGVLMWRGFSLSEFMDQCYCNIGDGNKGRQMPVHYGSKKYNFVTISSPLGTQMPQAVGASYAFKQRKENRIVCVYFGEGCASEGDAHAAFNFASTLNAPVIFFCRNNGYAISTPANEQYKGDGIAARGPGYGINSIRVDGNDIFAVYNATAFAKSYVLKEEKPVIVEAMTYRVSHHSTSDDSTAYRSSEEVKQWLESTGGIGPIVRLRKWLQNKNWWNDQIEKEFRDSARKKILTAFTEAENKPKPAIRDMFTDVYHEMPLHLTEQLKQMEEHITLYKDHYPVKQHEV